MLKGNKEWMNINIACSDINRGIGYQNVPRNFD